ncbi:hypothetical protein [Prevotellamassilia timonensis]|uniref:hypothetical protein n=1 Tax=Prevotellamassilia timonensis TaxID=1852370 RepID=UPI00307A8E1A
MKKRVLYLLCMAFAMMAWLPPQLWAQTQPSGGDGSSESPFLITTAEELKWYANYVNGESGDNVVHTTACAKLMNDIDLSTVCGEGKGNWTPIAKYDIYKYDSEYHFDGVFDGNGHTISNLYINDEKGSNLGLFGYIKPTASSAPASVKNLKMASVQIVGESYIAAVSGSGSGVTFENIEVISGSIAGTRNISGISSCVGNAKNCINRADVTASSMYAAGVIHYIGKVSNCSNYGKITAGRGLAGGIVSNGDGFAKLTDCANYGDIEITQPVGNDCGVGGLLGFPWYVEISNCANFGNIYLKAQSELVGVIVGKGLLVKASGILANTGNIYVGGTAQTDVPVLQSGISWEDNKVNNTATCLTPTAEQLASGWLAWQLQQNCSKQTWGQNISADPKDAYPVIGGSVVYAVGSCINIQFSNVSGVVTHNLTHHEAVAATCTMKGNHEYWYCSDCKTYFKEEACKNAYTDDADPNTGVWIEIPHTLPADFDENGLKYCSVCGHVEAEAPTLVADEASPFNGYYALSKAGHLVWLYNQVQVYDVATKTYPNESIKCYLANDISLKAVCHPADAANDVAEANWNPIGDNNPFKGIFDGNGHCIKNLYSSLYQGGYVGLFGSVYGGTIKNVTVEGVIESSCSNQGMIAGESVGANYYNCVAKGRIITSGNVEYVGGITGWFTPNSASIPVVRGCVSYVDIVSTSTFAGGLIGKSKNSIIMEACANYGNVTGKNNVGGLMGNTDPKTDTRITNCYVGSCEVRATGTETAPNVFLTCFEPSGKLSTFEKVFYSKDAKVFASADATEPEELATRIAYGAYNTSPAFVGFTAEQVAGGEATYYMNDATTASPVWTQDLSQANSQPELNGDAALYTVYKMGYAHGSTALSFSNNQADENTLHPEADNNGSHDKAYRYVSDGYQSCTHSATCRECGHKVESEACSRDNDICTKCHYGDLFELADGEAYTLANGAEVYELNYARNFGGTNWTTWYVPFELTLTPELCKKYAFSRINNVHQYDDNNDGVADRTIVESFNQAEWVTLNLVRALTDADKEMIITILNDVKLAKAESKHIDCMSVDHIYTFTGTYNEMGEGGTEANSPLSLFDYSDGNMWLNFHSLPAQRHYLVITPRDGSTPTLAPARVMLQVIGDETVTGIVNLYGRDKRSAETYDLSGRRVGSNQRGLLIKNGKKVLVK